MSKIRTETHDQHAKITINDPRTRNAVSLDMMDEISDAIERYDADPKIRAILLTGEGEAFCAGGDMVTLTKVTQQTPFEIKNNVYAHAQGLVRTVKLCKTPTIAMVHGAAAGAGCEMAIACDFRVVTPEAYFFESWVNLGIIAPLGGMFLLPQLVGLGKATEMLMLGTRVYGEEAVRIGLATRVTPQEQLETTAMEIVSQLAAGPPLAYPVFKEGLRRSADSTLATEWEYAIYAQAMLLNTEDFAEAVEAFKAKRKPVFQGK
jgi:enoyl-CoA hydratase/carnithine racemase